MSAAGRFALFISGLVAATSLLSSKTALDATKSLGSAPVWVAAEKPPSTPIESTVVTLCMVRPCVARGIVDLAERSCINVSGL